MNLQPLSVPAGKGCDPIAPEIARSGSAPRPSEAPPSAASVLVLGLGNDILRDDAVGLHVARAVRQALDGASAVHVVDTEEMGLALLDFVAGYRELILVDAVQTGRVAPGTIREFDGDALRLLPRISPHFLGVGEMLALGRQLGMLVPERVTIVAIEVEDPFTLGTGLSPAVAAAVPDAVERVCRAAGHPSAPNLAAVAGEN